MHTFHKRILGYRMCEVDLELEGLRRCLADRQSQIEEFEKQNRSLIYQRRDLEAQLAVQKEIAQCRIKNAQKRPVRRCSAP